MRAGRGLAVIVTVLAACGSSTAATTTNGGAGHPSCAPAHARLLAADGLAAVYEVSGTVYGCAGRAGRRYRLGTSRFCNNADQIGPVALSGSLAAYGVRTCGVDTGEAQVVVRRLADDKLLRSAAATSHVPGAESYASVGSVVVRSDGAVAWIGSARSIIGQGAVVEVHRLDRRGAAILDQGGGIATGSLRLQGSRLNWTTSGQRRSSTLD
jgi:hypothetical protein